MICTPGEKGGKREERGGAYGPILSFPSLSSNVMFSATPISDEELALIMPYCCLNHEPPSDHHVKKKKRGKKGGGEEGERGTIR